MPVIESVFAVLAGTYFLPSIIAGIKKRKNSVDILVLNIFLGWTIIGWIIALMWAVTGKSSLDMKIGEKKSALKRRIMATDVFGKWFGAKKR